MKQFCSLSRTASLLGVTLMVFLARAWAQDQATFSTDVKVVSLLATVHDRDGHTVKDLTQDDFRLQEDGVPQKIRYFSRETNLPLSIGLLVDTSRSQRQVLEDERRASYVFLDQVLSEDKDRAFVASFDIHVEIFQGLTSSRPELSSALDQLSIPSEVATLMYTAVQECSERVMRKQPGRKAFILLTDGVAFRDDTSIGSAIEFAQRADTIIYAIRFSGPIQARRPIQVAVQVAAKERGRDAMARMARETGGVAYEVGKDQDLGAIYAQIEEALRNQYSIGYTPDRNGRKENGKDGYRKIKLTTNDRKLTVNTREGYYAK